jgi:hypothetical protein
MANAFSSTHNKSVAAAYLSWYNIELEVEHELLHGNTVDLWNDFDSVLSNSLNITSWDIEGHSLEQYSSWDLTARTVTFDVPASDV